LPRQGAGVGCLAVDVLVMADERELTAIHEASHSVVTHARGWTPGALTVEGGTRLAGCATFTRRAVPSEVIAQVDAEQPFVMWPHEARWWIESEVMIALAGDIGEELFAPRTGRRPELVTVRAAEIAETLPLATSEERRATAAMCDDSEYESDAEVVARMMRLAHGPDLVSAVMWTRYLEAQVRALLAFHERRVRRLAEVATALGTVGGEALAAMLRDTP
jgi:hypothetical protein